MNLLYSLQPNPLVPPYDHYNSLSYFFDLIAITEQITHDANAVSLGAASCTIIHDPARPALLRTRRRS